MVGVFPLVWDAALKLVRPINGAGASGEQVDPSVLPAGSAPVFYTGQPVSVIGNAIPSGWPLLKLNGALVSRTSYANLWAYAQACGALVSEATWSATSWGGFSSGDGSTNFRLPDFRGEFPRYLDDGRGIDSGRSIGVWQADQVKIHTHPIYTSSSSGAGLSYIRSGDATGSSGTFATGTNSGGNSQNLVRNVPLLACIAY